MTLASRVTAASAAQDKAPFLGGMRAGDDVDLKGGCGSCSNNGRKSCNAVGYMGHVASFKGCKSSQESLSQG